VDQTYRIFTDGSAIGNPGPGGWGVVVIQGKERWEISGAHPWTTISEMELVAAVQALRSVEGRARVELYSDSEYLIYGMRAFVFRWQRHGWRNRRGTPPPPVSPSSGCGCNDEASDDRHARRSP